MPIREKITKALILLALTAILTSIFFPYWRLTIRAPQYPKGLKVVVYLNRNEGDVGEIDNLNHYIGMRPLAEAAKIERKLAMFGVGMLLTCLLLALAFSNRKSTLFLMPGILFPFFFVADLYYWMRNFGLNLDPHAALSSSVKPFIPPILGLGKIAQFKAFAEFDTGFYLSLTASVLILVCLFIRLKSRQQVL
jgi:copper chaperone NosL